MFLCLLIIFVSLINSSSVWSNGWHPDNVRLARPIMKAFNNERLNIDLYPITYHYQFNQALIDLFRLEYFTEINNKTTPFPLVGNLNNTIKINSYYVMDLPIMKFWKQYGMRYAFHYQKKIKLKDLIAKARDCYNPFRCSRSSFDNFISCFQDSKECAGSNRIYPYVYLRSFSRISCLESGKFMVCFGRYIVPKTSYPFDGDDDYN